MKSRMILLLLVFNMLLPPVFASIQRKKSSKFFIKKGIYYSIFYLDGDSSKTVETCGSSTKIIKIGDRFFIKTDDELYLNLNLVNRIYPFGTCS